MLRIVDEAGTRLPASQQSPHEEIRRQYLRMTPREQRSLRAILRQAQRLDRRLGELHLVLPAFEVGFYGLGLGEVVRFLPSELLEAIELWQTER